MGETALRAVLLTDRSAAQPVTIADLPEPERQPGQVLIQVKAGSLNRVDVYMRDSGAGITHTLPQVMGLDIAGEVLAVDDSETRLRVGQSVVVYPSYACGRCEFCLKGEPVLCESVRIPGEHVHGLFADQIAVPAANVFPAPAGLSMAELACLPVAYLTAWRMVMTKANVRATDDVLIFGIGGGVSLAAMQIAKAAGARCIVTSGSDAKLAQARALGADVTINHGTENVTQAVMAATGKRGVDIVIENVGQATWKYAMQSVVRGGKIICCGATSGGAPSADLQRLFIRQIQVIGSTLGNPGEFADLLLAVERHGIKPQIDRIFPMEQAAAALDHLNSGSQMGKVAISF